MNNIKKIASILLLFLGTILYTSCETLDTDLTENPNELSPANADVDYYLNGVQLGFAYVQQFSGENGAAAARINYMGGRTYESAFPSSSNGQLWNGAYQIMMNTKLMNEKAEVKGLKYHLGMGQVMQAFTMVTLVDYFGDVPYSEAFQGAANLNPKADSGKDIYAAALVLLDKAIVNFSGTSPVTSKFNDFYYGKKWSKWINAANSLKLKIYAQTRLVDPAAITKFDAIIASGKFIATSADDFQYEWNSNVANPDGRNPIYSGGYGPGGVGGYQSNSFMALLANDVTAPNAGGIADPRLKYYFYRQQNGSVAPEPAALSCSISPTPPHYVTGGFTFCQVGGGYWGRDHGDASGTPPDADKKTAIGVYPAGGKFDDDSFKKIDNTSGAGGDGITPIMLASTIDFLRAEIALNGGTGDAQALMLAGMQKSFTKVRSFAARDKTADLTKAPALSKDVTYMTNAGTKFAAATASGKMEILANEFFVALFGNGTDAYNFYRRTGYPKRIQPNLEPNPGKFVQSFFYPADETTANSNLPQKANLTTRVFWNPASNPDPIGN